MSSLEVCCFLYVKSNIVCTPAHFFMYSQWNKSSLRSERVNTHFLQVTPTPSSRKTLRVAISLQCEAALLTARYSALCLSPGLHCVLQVKRRLAESIYHRLKTFQEWSRHIVKCTTYGTLNRQNFSVLVTYYIFFWDISVLIFNKLLWYFFFAAPFKINYSTF